MNNYAIPFLPQQASSISGEVDLIYLFMVLTMLFFSAIIIAMLVVFVIKYHRRSPNEIPRPIAGAIGLELMWTIIPFFIAMGMFVWGAKIYVQQYHVPKDSMDMYVVGKQWMWKLQHPTGQREINELHVPLGRKVKLIMTTEDVIHCFYIPDFRVKADVIPGRYTTLWFEATKIGRYHLFCSEYCGTNHSLMGGWVEVMTPEDYERWLSGQGGDLTPAQAGKKLSETLGCASCHGSEGEGGRCPAWKGLYNTQVKLDNGATAVANEDYIKESILNPGAKIVAGYGNIMPTFQGQVSEEQLLQLIAYIKSIGPTQSAPGGGATTPSGATSGTAAKPAASPAQGGAVVAGQGLTNTNTKTAPQNKVRP
ncbi:MAG: cytochrome c oxidase subunit II [Pyrinomonadaceae bacterium]